MTAEGNDANEMKSGSTKMDQHEDTGREVAGSKNKRLSIALAGNPNSGKTTIFNNITGARQHVGNYPGVTVERVEGKRKFEGEELLFVDLPGTYSLTARSMDEVVARNTIINEEPDVLVDVLDASNLERNLYLAAQLLELERPLVVALNMVDVADDMGIKINTSKLSEALGATVVKTIGRNNVGTKELLVAVAAEAKHKSSSTITVDYGETIEPYIAMLIETIQASRVIKYPLRWLAIKLLEGDIEVVRKVKDMAGTREIVETAERLREELGQSVELDTVFQEYRHRFAVDVYESSLEAIPPIRETQSDRIDAVLTHRIFGLPIFFGIMWLLFNGVFSIGAYPQEWLDKAMSMLGDWITASMPAGPLQSLIVDGVIGGVGTVISFLPWILLLFLGISFLEDTGYMARAAFVVDRMMRAFGLHGKSFIPMLLGFGCTVTAVMGARILDNPKDRMVTILVSPFMSCSARMPVYILLSGAFFSAKWAGTVMFAIYFAGIVLAIIMAKIFRKTFFAGEAEPFVMEMPPYHMPTLKSVFIHMWERAVLYIRKAGTFILGAAIIVWFLVSYPTNVTYSQDFDQAKEQVIATYEQKNLDVVKPLGFTLDDDHSPVAALVKQMETTYAEEEDKAESESAAGEETDGTVYDKIQANEIDNDAEKVEPEQQYAEAFNTIKDANPTLYPFAYQVFKNDLAKDEALKDLDNKAKAEKLSQSYAARFGKTIEPIIKPLGFDWQIGVGLVAAMAAKEVLISTLGTIYAIEADADNDENLQMSMAKDPHFTPLVGLSLMVFILIYPPCIAALSVIGRETSLGWMAFIFIYGNVLAWVGSFIVYQGGRALGF